MLIGSGPSVSKYKDAISAYVRREKPFVVTLNINRQINEIIVDVAIVAHEQRFMLDLENYEKLEHPIIMPCGNFVGELGDKITSLKILDYGLQIGEEAFELGPKSCKLSSPLALSYALCVLTQARATAIRLVGFDGYDSADPRQEEVKKVFQDYQDLPNSILIESLTPTTYPIEQGSIFAPRLALNDFIVVIPARYESSRFPGKPLADLCGKSLIRHVWDKCVEAVGGDNVIVATDDERIKLHCEEQGMKIAMTSPECLTGTDRIFEVAQKIDRKFYVNVQGDEPLIEPSDILKILDVARSNPKHVINGMCKIGDESDFRSPNVPKVVAATNGKLLYMSRAAIPTGKNLQFGEAKRQVCIYAFPRDAVLKFGNQKVKSRNEQIEDIEILRYLDMGYTVKMVDVIGSDLAIDTEEDLIRARKILPSKEK